MLLSELRSSRRFLTAICGLSLCAGFLVASPKALGKPGQSAPVVSQTPAPSSTPPSASLPPASVTTLSVTAREILLDVLVTDSSGHPVTGLKASDFRVTEEGDSQVIKSLEEHHPMSAAEVAKLQSSPKLPPNTFTNFTPVANTNASTVILLDTLNTPLIAQMYLRAQMIAYLKNMQPGASIAIFQLDTEMRLIQGFSSDQQTLLAAAESKRDMPSLQRPIRGTPEEYRRVKREILRDGLQSMGRYLAAFPGRKNLIWFTGEVPLTIFGTGLGNPFRDSFRVVGVDNTDDLADALTLSRVAVYPIDTRGLQADPQFDVSQKGPPSGGAGQRFQVRQAFNEFDLDDVASATGGKAYYNTNGLKETIAEIVGNGSNYYSLAYSTTNKDWDGRFRKIKVVVDRPGVTVQHRRGYYATNRDEAEQRQLAALQKRRAKSGSKPPASNTSPASDDQPPAIDAVIHHPPKGNEANILAASMLLGAVVPTEIVFTANIAPDNNVDKVDKKSPLPANNFLRPDYKGKPFRTYNLLYRADLSRVTLAQTPDGMRHGTIEFVAVVYDQSGDTVNSLMASASVDLTEASYQEVLQKGLSIKSQIAIPVKGNYFLRLGVHNVNGDQIGALEIPLDQVKLDVAGQGVAQTAVQGTQTP
jgi:VWFA-related protein